MVSKFILFSNILLASLALASPFSGHGAYLARRRGNHQSQPDNLGIKSPAHSLSKRDKYTSNWAGAVWSAGSDNKGTFTTVQGTFTMPAPARGSSGAGTLWVGIDGYTCPNTLLQTGVYMYSYEDGTVSYSAFYEWLPAASGTFSDPITISTGDVITLIVTANSPTSGTAFIHNWTTHKNATEHLTSSNALCQLEAEWILEDPLKTSGLQPLGNFGTVTITGAAASDAGGNQYTPINGAAIINMKQGDKVLTSVSVDDNSGNLYIEHV